MKILPEVLHPWRRTFDRRHAPPAAIGDRGYRDYRQCLRWEFGFTCPFCLCHEADLALDGIEGTGITQIEHWIPVSHDKARINEYTNCFYICRYCNNSRGARPVVETGGDGRLLNPCEDVWDHSFSLNDDELEPRDGSPAQASPAARYTLRIYDLNEPRKVRRRRHRRTRIRERLEFIEQARELREHLLERATRTLDSELVEVAGLLEAQLRKAWQDLEHFQVVPRDAQYPCGCGDEGRCELPGVLEEQTLEVEAPFASGKEDSHRPDKV